VALVLNATPGSPSANSYATVAEADSYHESRLFTTDWTGATTAVKEAALVWATRLIDDMYIWYNYPTTDTQALQWPRLGMVASNRRVTIDQGAIPIELKEAVSEFARQLIVSDLSANNSVLVNGISSLSAGPISLSFKESFLVQVIPDAVDNMIPTWWGYATDKGSGMMPVLRS